MSAAAPNPNNLLMLAVIGIGAYWLMTRRVMAQPQYTTRPQSNANNTAALINAGGNLLSKLIGSGGSRGTYSPQNWASTDGRYNDMPIYSDGVAANNPYASPYDWWTANGSGGD
jgi:hypothetical protein